MFVVGKEMYSVQAGKLLTNECNTNYNYYPFQSLGVVHYIKLHSCVGQKIWKKGDFWGHEKKVCELFYEDCGIADPQMT